MRCDLGPVDDPHEPPCQRCRRESKECYFSATRRKRRLSGDEDELTGDGEGDASALYNVRKKTARSSASSQGQHNLLNERVPSNGRRPGSAASPTESYGLTGAEHNQSTSQYADPGQQGKSEDGQDQEVSNETAAALFQSPINTPGDALHLLLQASGQSEDIQQHKSTDSQSKGRTPTQELPTSSIGRKPPKSGGWQPSMMRNQVSAIDPAIIRGQGKPSPPNVSRETLSLWSRLRFVRAGWFTAEEAIAYIN